MFYAVKQGREPGIYEDKQKALEQIFKYPFSEMRTFKRKELAEEYMNKKIEVYYVVKKGYTPGIYTTREELTAQVKNYQDPIVKTFRDRQKAEKFFLEDIDELIRRKEEREINKKINSKKQKAKYQEKIENYLKNGISTHNKNICLIDVEANIGFAISLGAIIYDIENKQIVDTFYSLMRYESFQQMNSYCEHIHHINTKDILKAKISDEVFKEFISLIDKYEVLDIFSWGSTDKGFLKKSLSNKTLFNLIPSIENIQIFISFATKDILFNNRWSLQNMKLFYGIKGDVSHNALEDAKDLLKVFQCFQDKKEIDKNVVLSLKKIKEEN